MEFGKSVAPCETRSGRLCFVLVRVLSWFRCQAEGSLTNANTRPRHNMHAGQESHGHGCIRERVISQFGLADPCCRRFDWFDWLGDPLAALIGHAPSTTGICSSAIVGHVWYIS